MSDTALNKIIQYGTDAARIAFTPNPAAGSKVLYFWYATDTFILYLWNGSAWTQASGSTVLGLISVNTSTIPGFNYLASESIEIASGIIFEIASGSRVEITGSGVQDLGWFDLSNEVNVAPVSLNLSTFGTIDWFNLNISLSTPPQISNVPHYKARGGWIWRSFSWIYTGATSSLFAQASFNTCLSTAGDDANESTLNQSSGVGLFTSTGALYGFTFNIPVSPTRRLLYLHFNCFNAQAQLVVSFRDSRFPSKTYNYTRGPNAQGGGLIKVAYQGNAGDELIISVINQSTGLGAASNPNIKFNWAAITAG